jgi:hypothetical protein
MYVYNIYVCVYNYVYDHARMHLCMCTYVCTYVYIYVCMYVCMCMHNRLCGLVVRVPGYRSGSPGFDSRALQGKKVVGLERGPLSLVEYN